ncbi:MAG TPA: hypothetical protein VMM76_08295 [Pirellulaceae bacterium]|nr:hypothetical protein [Pirellulaceae bacterium]
MNRDQDHLRLLGLFHYVHAALLSCTTSFGVVYVGFFATMMPMITSEIEADAARQQAAAKQAEVADKEQDESGESVAEQKATDAEPSVTPPGPPAPQPVPIPVGAGPPEALFSMLSSMMYGMGAAMLLFGFSMAFANVYAARCIARRKHRTFCLLTAGFNCLNTPLGLILGVCAFIVLLRPTVEDLFDERLAEQAAIIDADIVD